MREWPRLFAPPSPAFASRREFLDSRAGNGGDWHAGSRRFAARAGAARQGRRRRPSISRNLLAPARRAFSGEGEVRHLAVHERWAESGRYLGPQARTGSPRWPTAAGLRSEHRLLHRQRRPGHEVAVSLSAARRLRQVGLGNLPSNTAKHVDRMAFLHSLLDRRRTTIRPPLYMMNTGFSRMGYPCVGSWVTYGPRAARTAACPASSRCTTRWAAACRKETRRTGGPAFCRASTRGRCSSRRAPRSTTCIHQRRRQRS